MSNLVRINEPEAYASEIITVTSVSIGFSAQYISTSRVRQIKKVYLQNAASSSAGNITFRVDGASATSTTGYVLRQYETATITGESDILNFSSISVNSATNGELRITYFR